MGLFKRLHRITIGRIEALLARAEDPEIIFPELVKEMEAQFQAAVEAEGKASAAVRRAKRDLARQDEKIDRLDRGARRALQAGDEATARMAVEAQIDTERLGTILRENLDRATDALDHAMAARKHVGQQLDELRGKKDEILTRSRIARVQKRIQRSVTGAVGSTDSILDAVARLEDQVADAEAELEIQATLSTGAGLQPSLERRLRELDTDGEVEQRLRELRVCVESETEAPAGALQDA